MEFSCVRVMIAFGGKREKGVRKDRKLRTPVRVADGSDADSMICGGFDERIEYNVRNTVVRKNTTAIMTLGGRMMRRIRVANRRTGHLVSLEAAAEGRV